MSGLFGGPKPMAPPPVPQLDEAAMRRNEQDRAAKRGRGTTILTSDSGLPDLGATTRAVAGGQ